MLNPPTCFARPPIRQWSQSRHAGLVHVLSGLGSRYVMPSVRSVSIECSLSAARGLKGVLNSRGHPPKCSTCATVERWSFHTPRSFGEGMRFRILEEDTE